MRITTDVEPKPVGTVSCSIGCGGGSITEVATAGSELSDGVSPNREPDDNDRWWSVFARNRHVPRLIRQRAQLRGMARADQRRAARRDPADNRDTRIPAGEQVLMPVLWLAELYTPTTLHGLLSGLRPLMSRTGDHDPRRGDIVEWVNDARRQGGGHGGCSRMCGQKGPPPLGQLDHR
jgi:hypothetical protein